MKYIMRNNGQLIEVKRKVMRNGFTYEEETALGIIMEPYHCQFPEYCRENWEASPYSGGGKGYPVKDMEQAISFLIDFHQNK